MTTQLEALAAKITAMSTVDRLRFAADLIVVADLEPESRRAATLKRLQAAQQKIEDIDARKRLNARRSAR